MRTAHPSLPLGFTLIEVLIATIVLTLGLLALSAQIHAIGSRGRSTESIVDLDLRARSVVESLRSVGYSRTSVGRSLGTSSEIRIWNDTLGTREILVVTRETRRSTPRADTLATRLGPR